MSIFDFVLIIVLFGFVWSGFWAGLIRTLGSLVGTLAGVLLAGIWYDEVGVMVKPIVGGNELVANIIGFVLILLLASQLTAAVFWFINKAFNILAIVPGLKLLNRLGGGILGFLEGAFLIGITLDFVSRLPISPAWAERIADSRVVEWFTAISSWLVPLLPKALEEAKSLIR